QRRDRAQAEVSPPRAGRPDDAYVDVGAAIVSGQAGRDELGRAGRVRCLHDLQRHGARRHEIQGLVNLVVGKSGNRVIGLMIAPRRRRARSAIAAPSGFTLIELLVVISLIVILATMGLAQYRTSVIHSREAVLKEDLFRMRDAIDQYYADKGQYPSSIDA